MSNTYKKKTAHSNLQKKRPKQKNQKNQKIKKLVVDMIAFIPIFAILTAFVCLTSPKYDVLLIRRDIVIGIYWVALSGLYVFFLFQNVCFCIGLLKCACVVWLCACIFLCFFFFLE